jgi:phosphomannomutase
MPSPVRATLFDLDDTLAESFQPPSAEIIVLLARLLEKMPVAILTAAGWPRIEQEFLEPLSKSPRIDRFFVFPNSSAQCFIHENGTWKEVFNENLSDDERKRIKEAIFEATNEVNIRDAQYSPLVIDRGAQIAYAAVGLDAPLQVKKAWDPDQSKRKRLREAIEKRVPDVEVRIGGMTTIDITKKGVSKAHGVTWLAKHLGIATEEMLYIGDALYPGGNDEVVIPTGIQTRETSGPERDGENPGSSPCVRNQRTTQVATDPGIAASCVDGEQTVTRPTELTLISYPVFEPDASTGSSGTTGIYVGARHPISPAPPPLELLTLVLAVGVGKTFVPQAPPKIPLLSAIF